MAGRCELVQSRRPFEVQVFHFNCNLCEECYLRPQNDVEFGIDQIVIQITVSGASSKIFNRAICKLHRYGIFKNNVTLN